MYDFYMVLVVKLVGLDVVVIGIISVLIWLIRVRGGGNVLLGCC